MKSLKDFLFEAANDGKEFVFAFKGLENGEETVKSLADVYGCTANEEKQEVSITVTKDNASKLDTAQDILQQYTQVIRSSTKRASDEQYAQKTKSFENKVNEFNKAIEDFLNDDADSHDADQHDDKKKEEKDSKEEE